MKVALRTAAVGLAAVAVVATAGLAGAQPIVLPATVQVHPAPYTPNVEDGAGVDHAAVYALKSAGTTMYAGGNFQLVDDSNRQNQVTRHNLFSFDTTTGSISNFAPAIDGDVWAIETDPATGSVWVGGFFSHVDGTSENGIAKFTNGVLDTTFKAGQVAGPVTEIRLVNGRLLVAGNFPKKLVAINPNTGANLHYFDSTTFAGSVSSRAGVTKVYRFAVNPTGDTLVAIGNFTSVGGQHRYRAVMLDLGATAASIDPWYYQPLDNACRAASLPAQLRDVDFSSDGTWFVIDATGYIPVSGGLGRDICDAAARFETANKTPSRPTWLNYTGGDTLHSVAISGDNVYVQGHQRWLNNAGGTDSCNVAAGCVSRPGIGDIDATTGLATAWNPTKTRGVGGKDLLITPQGLWVASDGATYNNKYHHGIALAPE